MAEEHETVAVGRRRRRMIEDDRFPVHVFGQFVEVVEIGLGRQRVPGAGVALPPGALILLSTLSWATINAFRPGSAMAPPKPKPPARTTTPDAASFPFPPTCSGAALVL